MTALPVEPKMFQIVTAQVELAPLGPHGTEGHLRRRELLWTISQAGEVPSLAKIADARLARILQASKIFLTRS